MRPTSERAREAVFDMLSSLGVLDGAAVADLFAGSGAMGIEALSRGARSAVFVDDRREAALCVERNLGLFGWGRGGALGVPADPYAGSPPGRAEAQEGPRWTATVVQMDALRWATSARQVDVAFCDPPYAYDRWTALLDQLSASVVVAESDREILPPAAAEVLKVRRYGTTVVTLIQRDPTDGTSQAC